MRRLVAGLAVAATAGSTALLGIAPAGAANQRADSTRSAGTQADYVVLQDSAGSTADAVKAVESAGGTVVSQNASLGYVIARSSSSAFAATVDPR